jgi:hypothetical protein
MGRKKHLSRTTRVWRDERRSSTHKVSIGLRREPSKIHRYPFSARLATRRSSPSALVETRSGRFDRSQRGVFDVPLLGEDQTQRSARNVEENRVEHELSDTRHFRDFFVSFVSFVSFVCTASTYPFYYIIVISYLC